MVKIESQSFPHTWDFRDLVEMFGENTVFCAIRLEAEPKKQNSVSC